MKLAAVLFDMDGLLFDSERIYARATDQALVEIGQPSETSFGASLAGYSAADCLSVIRTRFGPDFDMQSLDDAYEWRKGRLIGRGVPLKPGARDLIRHVRRLRFPIGLVTGSSSSLAQQYLQEANLAKSFDVVVTRDDVRHGKPAPDSYYLAARQLDVPSFRCLAFEDSYPGLQSAVAAGMQVAYVPDLAPVPPSAVAWCWVLADLVSAIRHTENILRAAERRAFSRFGAFLDR